MTSKIINEFQVLNRDPAAPSLDPESSIRAAGVASAALEEIQAAGPSNVHAIEQMGAVDPAGLVVFIGQTLSKLPEEIQAKAQKVLKEGKEAAPAKSLEELLEARRTAQLANAAMVGGATLCQSLLNHLLGNTTIGSKATATGLPFLVNIVFTSVISQVLKGNWKEVGSYKQQLGVLLATFGYTALTDLFFAFVLDLQREVGPSDAFGPTTILALTTVFAFACKMCATAAVGKKSYEELKAEPKQKKGDKKAKPKVDPAVELRGRRINCAMVGASAIVTALFYQISKANPADAAGVIVALTFSGVFRTAGKAVIKSLDNPSEQGWALMRHLSVALTCSALVATAFDPHLHTTELKDQIVETAVRFGGPVAATALSQILTNLWWRIDRREGSSEPDLSSWKGRITQALAYLDQKGVINAAALLATNLGAAAFYRIVEDPLAMLAATSCQIGWTFHELKGLFKKLSTSQLQRFAIMGGGIAAVAATELLLRTSELSEEEAANFRALFVTLGTTATFVGKALRYGGSDD
jgi:hypothetical protein